MFILLPINVHFRCLIVLRYYNQLPITVRQCPVLQCPVLQFQSTRWQRTGFVGLLRHTVYTVYCRLASNAKLCVCVCVHVWPTAQ